MAGIACIRHQASARTWSLPPLLVSSYVPESASTGPNSLRHGNIVHDRGVERIALAVTIDKYTSGGRGLDATRPGLGYVRPKQLRRCLLRLSHDKPALGNARGRCYPGLSRHFCPPVRLDSIPHTGMMYTLASRNLEDTSTPIASRGPRAVGNVNQPATRGGST